MNARDELAYVIWKAFDSVTGEDDSDIAFGYIDTRDQDTSYLPFDGTIYLRNLADVILSAGFQRSSSHGLESES